MFCVRCGNELREGHAFCTKCGLKAESNSKAVAQEQPIEAAEEATSPIDLVCNEEVPEAPALTAPAPEPAIEFRTDEDPYAPVNGLAIDDAIPWCATAEIAKVDSEESAEETVLIPVQPEGTVPIAFDGNTQYGQAHPPKPAAKRTSRAAAIAVGSVAVLAVAAIAVLFAFGIVPGTAPEAKGTEPTKCTSITRIYPEDSQGNPLTDYRVDIIDKSTGKKVAEVEVKDDGGFAVGDIEVDGQPLPNGQYDTTIHDNESGETSTHTIEIVSDGDPEAAVEDHPSTNSDSTLSSNPSDSSSSANASADPAESKEAREKALAKSYLDVVNSYVKKYGAPSIREASETRSVNGVAFAKILDIDADKEDELLLVYYDESLLGKKAKERANDGPNDPSGYVIEVYDFDGKSAKSLYKRAANTTNKGFAYARLYKDAKGYYLKPITRESKDGATETVATIVRFSDGKCLEKEFKTHNVKSSDEAKSSSESYEVDGKAVSKDKYNEALESAAGDSETETYVLTKSAQASQSASSKSASSSDKQKQYSPDELVSAVDSVIASLKARAGESSQSAKKSSGAASSSSAAKSSGTAESSEPAGSPEAAESTESAEPPEAASSSYDAVSDTANPSEAARSSEAASSTAGPSEASSSTAESSEAASSTAEPSEASSSSSDAASSGAA